MKKNRKRILCLILFIVMEFNFEIAIGNREWELQRNFQKVQAAEADENGFVIEDGVLKEYQGKEEIVKIPEGVIEIGEMAFYNCNNLISVEIPNSVINIGSSAFMNCVNLISIEIPNSMKNIGFLAFAHCINLTSVEIPNSVTSIGSAIFADCSNLKKIQVDNTNLEYISIDGILFTKNKETLIQYPAGRKEKKYSIPNSVKEIKKGAFGGCNKLISIEIPSSVMSIGKGEFLFDGAFGYCESLKEIQVDDTNLEYISIDGILFTKDKETLVQCPAGKEMRKYSIPDSVILIKEGAFSGCSKLTSIEIPDSVLTVEINAFCFCDRLIDVKISNSLTKINFGMFSNCSKLISIEIPNSVEEIENTAFFNTGLLAIAIPDSVVKINENIIDRNKNFKIYCHKDSTAHTYAIEKGYNYVLVEGDIGEAMRKELELMKLDLKLKKKKIILKKGQKSKVKLLSKYDSISYESKNPLIASVSNKGTIIGKKKGKTVILVTVNGITVEVKIIVKSAFVNEILLNKNMKLSKKSISLKKGTKLEIQKASDISGKIIYKSSNKKIVTVSAKGVIKAKKKGKTVILIKNDRKTIKLKITVKR